MFKSILNGAIIPIEGARPVAAIISIRRLFQRVVLLDSAALSWW